MTSVSCSFFQQAEFGTFHESLAPLPEDVATREVNGLATEVKKRKKDEKKQRNIARQTAKQDHATRRRAGEIVPSED